MEYGVQRRSRVAIVAFLAMAALVVPTFGIQAAPAGASGGFTPPEAAVVPGSTPLETAVIVATHDLSALSPPSIDPAGVVYLPEIDSLLVSDSEIDEEAALFVGVNLFGVDRNGTLVSTGLTPDTPKEPTGLGYDPATRRLFVSNDGSDRVYQVLPGVDGTHGTPDDVVTSFAASVFGATDVEDVAFDTRSGDLFIADGVHAEVFRIDAGPNGIFDGVASDDVVSSFDVGADGVGDAEGIGYRESSDTILVVDGGADEAIYEYTKDGFLLRKIDLSAINLVGPAEVPSDVAVAPASDGGGSDNLYLVDRKTDNGDPNDGVPPPMDGTLYELAVPFADLPPYVDAGVDAVTTVGMALALDGFAVDDGQPAPVAPTVTWSKVSGPGTVSFANATALATTATFSAEGTYVVQLEADDTNATTVDTVEITVIAAPVSNDPPVASAGADQSVTIAAGATLVGTGTDDGLPVPPGAVSASWTKASGPGSVTFGNPASFQTTARFGAVGTYVLALTVSDGLLTAVDTATISVSPNPPGTTPCDLDEPIPFVDLGGLSAEAILAIECLVDHGVTVGTSPTTFSPNLGVARWQMALFLTREASALGFGLPTGADQGFVDIGHHDVATQTAINQLAQMGITVGTGPNTFAPDQTVTRWQMALFLNRLLEFAGVDAPATSGSGFVDLGGLSAEAVAAIDDLVALEVAKGTSATTYSPNLVVSRWQMALFLNRTFDVGAAR